MKRVFITGTDTHVGKTYITVKLLKQINSLGFKTFGIKPIASGCTTNCNGALNNDDALAIQEASSICKPYHIVNPIALEAPIAPNLAAKHADIKLSVQDTAQLILSCIQPNADINIIEGVGGWSVPLNNTELFCETVHLLELPIVLVVGIRLGCLNHAILTCNSIRAKQLPFIGWIANCLDPNTLSMQDIIQTLKQWLPAPFLGTIPHSMNNQVMHYDTINNIIKYLFK
jgi:dethiobiotin synthetase